jgi:hypothetical protein
MPTVNGKKFPYTKEGIIASEQARESQANSEEPTMESPDNPVGEPVAMESTQQGGNRGSGESNVSPEEQQEFDKYTNIAQALVYDKKIATKLLQMGKANKDPIQGLGGMVSLIVLQVDEKSKNELPESMILPLSEQVMGMIVEIIETGMDSKLPEEKVAKAYQIAVSKLLQNYGVDEAGMESALSQLDPNAMRDGVNKTAESFGEKPVFGMGA